MYTGAWVSVTLPDSVSLFSEQGKLGKERVVSMWRVIWQRLYFSPRAGSSRWCFSTTAAARTKSTKTWKASREATMPRASAGTWWLTPRPSRRAAAPTLPRCPRLAWASLANNAAPVRGPRARPTPLCRTVTMAAVTFRAGCPTTAAWSPARSPLMRISTWTRPWRLATTSRPDRRSSPSIRATRPVRISRFRVTWTCP